MVMVKFLMAKICRSCSYVLSFFNFGGDEAMVRKAKKLAYTTLLAMIMSVMPFSKAHRYAEPLPSARILKDGKASWYSRNSPGIRKHTANNEVFNDEALTCAMWGAKFNQKLRITNKANGKSIVVRVNDRGPHKRYVYRGRVIDLTQRAFKELSSTKHGLINVQIEFL